MGAEDMIPAERPLAVDYERSGLRKYLNLPFGWNLEAEIRKATYTAENIHKARLIKWDATVGI